jgi:hypothetical protein
MHMLWLRSLFAVAAALLFAYLALTFVAEGAFVSEQYEGEVGQAARAVTTIEGTEAGVAVTSAARTLSWGLALLALALVEWRALAERLRTPATTPAPPEEPLTDPPTDPTD